MSVSLMAMTMIQMGVTAISLNAWQVPMHTTSAYENAKLKRIDSERITKELDSNKIVVATGFQGVNKYDDVAALGQRRFRHHSGGAGGCAECGFM